MRVKELAWDTDASCRLDTFTLKDAFIHCYGSHDDILDAHGLGVPELSRPPRPAMSATLGATA